MFSWFKLAADNNANQFNCEIFGKKISRSFLGNKTLQFVDGEDDTLLFDLLYGLSQLPVPKNHISLKQQWDSYIHSIEKIRN